MAKFRIRARALRAARGALILALCSFLPAVPSRGVAQQTDQPQGIRSKPSTAWALTGARIQVAPDRVIEKGTVFIEAGKILAVGAKLDPPAHATKIDLSGSTIYPGFFDAYEALDIAREEGKKGASYWNTAIRPQLSTLDHLSRDDGLNAELRR